MRKSRSIQHRNFRGAMLTAAIYGESIRSVLRREFGHLRRGADIIAEKANVTTRTAQNWLQGLCAPQGAALLNLCAQCEAVDAEMARLKALARGERA